MNLKDYIRDIHDFPIKGIVFKDIMPLLSDADAFKLATEKFATLINGLGITKIVGIESRGFIFGCALANHTNIGFAPIRKPGKLPSDVFSESYLLEYGSDTLEIHKDALTYTDRVLLIDDLLATGGTASAALKLIRQTGANVSLFATLIELSFLNGVQKLGSVNYKTLISY